MNKNCFPSLSSNQKFLEGLIGLRWVLLHPSSSRVSEASVANQENARKMIYATTPQKGRGTFGSGFNLFQTNVRLRGNFIALVMTVCVFFLLSAFAKAETSSYGMFQNMGVSTNSTESTRINPPSSGDLQPLGPYPPATMPLPSTYMPQQVPTAYPPSQMQPPGQMSLPAQQQVMTPPPPGFMPGPVTGPPVPGAQLVDPRTLKDLQGEGNQVDQEQESAPNAAPPQSQNVIVDQGGNLKWVPRSSVGTIIESPVKNPTPTPTNKPSDSTSVSPNTNNNSQGVSKNSPTSFNHPRNASPITSELSNNQTALNQNVIKPIYPGNEGPMPSSY